MQSNLPLVEQNDQELDNTDDEDSEYNIEDELNEETSLSLVTLDSIIRKSNIQSDNSDEQSEKIVNEFNRDVKESCFAFNVLPGRALNRVPANCFLMGHRNQITELCDPKGQRVALTLTADPTVVIKSLGIHRKTSEFFGEFGKFVLNVPPGHYAKAMQKNLPVFFDEGSHVIIDTTLEFRPDPNPRTGFVSQLEPYIQHQTLHILRIPAGKVAKIWIGTIPRILESRKEPYVFNDPQFKLVLRERDNQNDKKDHNKNLDNKNLIDDMFKQQLIKSNSVDKNSLYFHDAIAQIIEHGSIKRIIPHTGEVAITYRNGILHIIHPTKDGRPIFINSSTHQFEGFTSTSLQTHLFPSEDTKAQAAKDNPRATVDEKNMKIFQTRDSLRIGVVLVVAFRISDPQVAITKLGKGGILPHIENVAFADMGKAIQLSTISEVLFTTTNRPTGDTTTPSVNIQDLVKKNLAKDLEDYGIELARMNIETMKVLDEEIAKKLAGQSVTTAEYTTKQATLVKEYDIKTTEAKMKAETENIAVQQRNQALIAEAQARLESSKRESEALLVEADARKKAEEMKGSLYARYPKLYELEMARIKVDMMRNATIYLTPQQLSTLLGLGSLGPLSSGTVGSKI